MHTPRITIDVYEMARGRLVQRLPRLRLPISIGRSQGSDVVLESKTVSKQHAQLRWADRGMSLYDLDSTNGVYVDGERITGGRLLRGCEEVCVGTFILRLSMPEFTDARADQPAITTRGGVVRPQSLSVIFAPEDSEHQALLLKHLKVLQSEGLVYAWAEQLISAEQPRLRTAADLLVLLVSADLLARGGTMGAERALTSTGSGRRARMIPIVVRPTMLDGTPLAALALLPEGNIAVSRWPDPDEAWVSVVGSIRRVLLAGRRDHGGGRP